METIGLSVTLDGAANLVGARPGTDASLPPIVVGSHSDTVPEGGRFDGIAGVVAGLEVAAALADNGVALRHPLWVVDFLAEEPSEYGVSCVGSRIWAGTLTDSMMHAPSPEGETLAEAVVRVGGSPDALPGPMKRPGDIAGSVELHIEQARLLESRNLAVGVVTGNRWNHPAADHRARPRRSRGRDTDGPAPGRPGRGIPADHVDRPAGPGTGRRTGGLRRHRRRTDARSQCRQRGTGTGRNDRRISQPVGRFAPAAISATTWPPPCATSRPKPVWKSPTTR